MKFFFIKLTWLINIIYLINHNLFCDFSSYGLYILKLYQ